MTKEDLKEYVNKGVQASKEAFDKASKASKEAFDKAGKAVSKFGDESILKIEIQQFKSQIKKNKAELGELAYKAFIEEGADSLQKETETVASLIESIKKAQEEIKSREEKLATQEDTKTEA